MIEQLKWVKYPVLNDGFICLVDVMGDDSAIVQAARVSYGKDNIEEQTALKVINEDYPEATDYTGDIDYVHNSITIWKGEEILYEGPNVWASKYNELIGLQASKDRGLIRRLMMDSHTSPFEMVEFKFKIRVPMDCWRQWIRHRTANVNEYYTRYSEAIDSQQTTLPEDWRLQAKDNKQGSSGFLEEWPEKWNGSLTEEKFPPQHPINTRTSNCKTPGQYLSAMEERLIEHTTAVYRERLEAGIAREQARKDLPLSTYTEAYWKCDLHNIFNFLRLRLDKHAQLEIRLYAQAMYNIVKQVCPIASEAFEDYVLNAVKFSAMEMHFIREMYVDSLTSKGEFSKPPSMTDNEWKKFVEKLA